MARIDRGGRRPPDDIQPIVEVFTKATFGNLLLKVLVQALIAYDWAGNVRELENAVERAVVFTNTKKVPLSVLPQFLPQFADTPHSLTFKISTPWRMLESQAIDITLAQASSEKP